MGAVGIQFFEVHSPTDSVYGSRRIHYTGAQRAGA